MSRGFLTAGLLPVLLLAANACTKAGDGPGIASVNGSATPSVTSTLSFQEQGLQHARCMREHGVPEADPVVDGDNVRVSGGYDKSSIDDAVLRAAIEACKRFEPVLPPDELAKKLESAREEARCMRANGVENFPDPGPDLRFDVPETVREDPDFDRAKAACVRRGGRSPSPAR